MSRAVRRYGTPADLASQRPQPPRRYSQSELRERRRAGLSVTYTGEFSLAREIADLCEPLARRIAAADRPARFRFHTASVPWLAEDVHELVGVVVGWVAEADL